MRQTNPQARDHFTYEGYYGQQAAQNFTNSVIAIIKSEDVGSLTLENMNVTTTEKSLRKLRAQINIKKAGPQVITLQVKDKDASYSKKLWQELTDQTTNLLGKVDRYGDPQITVTQLAGNPVTRLQYSNMWLNISVGTLLGMFFSLLIVTFKIYWKETK